MSIRRLAPAEGLFSGLSAGVFVLAGLAVVNALTMSNRPDRPRHSVAQATKLEGVIHRKE